MLSIPNTDL